MRLVLALIVGVVVMALGAVMLGEYELVGVMPYVAGAIFGLVIGEVLAGLSRQRTLLVSVAAAALTAGGLTWAAWIAAARDWSYVPTPSWIGVAVGATVGAVWVKSSGRREPSSLKPTEPPPAD